MRRGRAKTFGQTLMEMNAVHPLKQKQEGSQVRPFVVPSNGKAGKPSVYDPVRFPHIAKILCREYGFTAEQLGQVFGVSKKTVEDWVLTKKEFKDAVQEGRDAFDSIKVENALLKIALGYEYQETSTKTVKVRGVDSEGNKINVPAKEITVTNKVMAPNAKAIAFWLTNRQRDRWQQVSTVNANVSANTEHTEKTLNVTADLSKMDSVQLRALRDLITTQKSGDVLQITGEDNNDSDSLQQFISMAENVLKAEDTILIK